MSKKNIMISGLVGILLLATVGAYFIMRKPKIEYRFAEIKKGNITLKVLATGTVQPENRLQIKSPIAGRAESVLVREGQKVYRGQVLAWISSSERAALIDAARAQGAEELKKWEDIYKATPIIAPLSGTIILRAIEPGQTFSTADAILVMSDRLTVSAQVDETDLAQISLKQKAKISLDAYSDKEFDAEVSQLAYEAKTVNNVTTYMVNVLPKEKLDFLRSGMTANVTFFGQTREDIVVIPNEFIKYDSGVPKAMVKQDEKRSIARELALGITDGKITEVKSGLEVGETVVLEIQKDTKSKSSLFSPPQSRQNQRR